MNYLLSFDILFYLALMILFYVIISDDISLINLLFVSIILLFFQLTGVTLQDAKILKIGENFCDQMNIDKSQCLLELENSSFDLGGSFKIILNISKKNICKSHKVFTINNGKLENSNYKCKETLKFEILNQKSDNFIKIVDIPLIDQALNSQKEIILSKSKEFLNNPTN